MSNVWNNHNLGYRICVVVLIILHLATFGPVRDCFAFDASSASYKLNSGTMNEGGNSRSAASTKLWQDVVGEPCQGRAQSASYILDSGLLPTIQSNPPLLTQEISYQTWAINTSKANAFDLDDYFSSPEGYPLTFSVTGNSRITITIDSATHAVSFSQAEDWFGVEKVYFKATDSEGNTFKSNEVVLQVANSAGQPNKPVIVNTQLIPSAIKEGDLVTLTVKAYDLDNQDLTFTYSDFFTETRHWKDGSFWFSEATWQSGAHSTGHYTVRVTVSDGALTDTDPVIVNIGNFNHSPVLGPISDITANEGDLVVITPQATDVDNDPIIFYYSAPFDSQGKWLTNYDSQGTYNIQVTASDGIDTVSTIAKVIIHNTNRPPQVSLTLSSYTIRPNQQINVVISASDPDGDSMTFSLKKDGTEIASGNISSTYNTTISFPDIGNHNILATVTDVNGAATTDTKGVDVADPNTNRDAINPVMGDFNGDALTDLGLHNSDTGTWEACISDKGVFRNAVTWLTGFGTSRDWWPIGGDFDGDAKTDVGIYNNLTGELKVALSTGSSFSVSGIWFTFSGASYSWQPFAGNFNGDKYTDFALYNKDTGEIKIALGTGSGFGSFTTWLAPNDANKDYIALGGDFNGDSLTDLCLFKKSSGEFKVYFSNTAALVDGSTWISGFAIDKDTLISDFNNDGLADIGCWDKNTGIWYYAISNGWSFTDKGTWLSGFGTSSDESATTGDFDGNGITDAACFDKDQLGINRWNTRLSQDKFPDLLTGIDNGIGGKTQVTYTYSASSDNPDLPFPVYVASSISLVNTVPADRTATYTQNFTFSGGYYDAGEREFRGFAKVRITDPITNNYSETYFYQGKPGQDGALKGQIDKVISYDGNSRKISQAINAYDVKKAGPEDRFLGFPALVEQNSTVWEENGTSLATKDCHTYDNIGNLIKEDSYADQATAQKFAQVTYSQAYEVGFNRPLESMLKDKGGNLISKKNFEYDNKGNLTKETSWLDTQGPQPYAQYTYDSFGNLISTTNALGSTVITDYETDFYTYPIRVTNSQGHSIQYVYEPKFGVVKSTIDTNGNTSSTTYDSLARVLQVKNAYDQVITIYSYPDFNTKATSNALGLFKTEYIDGLGRKYKAVSSGEDGSSQRNVVSEVFYNSRGLTDNESLPHYVDEDPGQISFIRYEYDIRGRIKKTISDFPGSSADAESSINYINLLYTETTDPLGHRKGTLKDIWGNIVEVSEFTSGGVYKTNYLYDAQNNLIKTIDNQGNITQVFYDSLGRKIRMIDPDMGTWTYEYDLLGNLMKQADAKSQILEFTYDSLNRLIVKRGLSTQGTVPVTLATYIYDDAAKDSCIGRLSKITDQSGSTEFFYDKLGREIKSIKTIDSIPYTVERTYDVLDRLTCLTYPDAAYRAYYSYDNNSGLLENVATTFCVFVENITYNAKGQIKTMQYGGDSDWPDCGRAITTSYTYGQDLRLSRILASTSTSTLQDLNYIFDKNGNVTTLADNLRSNIRSFTYDGLDRLTQAQNIPVAAGGYSNFNYQYDSIGNMTYKSDLGVMTYGLNAGPHALTGAGGYTYQYDRNGNMAVGKNKTLSYDAENRLTAVNELGTITSFTYDGDGGRVKKVIGSDSTTYIGSLFEKDSDGAFRLHVFAGATRVATVEPSKTYYYLYDHLGSSSVVINPNGDVLQRLDYAPYGSVSRTEGAEAAKYKFTGKELDATGLYFYGARYYDPEIGRFISADTIVQAPYDPQSLNRYSYCRNNPINYVDPSGHFWWFIPMIIGAIIGAVSAGIQSDWNLKATLVGAGIGAISGVVGFGAGGATSQILGRVGSAAFGGMLGGASAGALSSAYYGGDLLRGTLMGAGLGALGGLAFGVLSQIDVTNLASAFTKVSLFAATGGGLSELGGGKFWQGAVLAGAVAMSEVAYKAVLATNEKGRKISNPSMETATGDANEKLNADNKTFRTVLHDDGSAQVGIAYGPNTKTGLFHENAGWLQWIAKNIPGVQGTALFHDLITYYYGRTPIGFTNGLIFNVPSMPAAFAITALGSAANSAYLPMLGQFALYGENSQ